MPASPDDGARQAAQVADLVAEAETALLRRIADALRTGMDDPDWERRKLEELQLLRRRLESGATSLDAAAAEAIHEAVISAYHDGAALALNDLDDLDRRLPDVPSIAPAQEAAQAATTQASAAIGAMPRLLTDVFREAVAAGAAEVLGGAVTRRQASQHVLDRLASRGITGYRDKAGRNWSLSSYVEMATRTSTGQAAVQGHVDTLGLAGIDLVIVSDSPRECPLCRPWENKILSVSGRVGAVLEPSVTGGEAVRVDIAGTLDQAKRDGLQHPNCRHSVSAYQPGATQPAPPTSDPDGYRAGQRQREMERKIRQWKRRQALALDDEAAARAAGKVRQWQGALREHVDAHDLKRLRYREQIGRAI